MGSPVRVTPRDYMRGATRRTIANRSATVCEPGERGTQAVIGGEQVLRHDAHVAEHRHEVRVAAPARDDVEMAVVRIAGTRDPPDVVGRGREDIRDADDLLAAEFEVLTTAGEHMMVPIERVRSIDFEVQRRVRDLIAHGLGSTADEWPAIRTAFSWLHQAAHLLNNSSERNVHVLRQAYRRLLAKMRQGAHSTSMPAWDTYTPITRRRRPVSRVCRRPGAGAPFPP